MPRPFKGPLGWLGRPARGRRATGSPDRFDDVDGALPGGAWLVWVLLGDRRRGRGRARWRARGDPAPGGGHGRGAARRPRAVADPRDLEREADAAERAGDFERAVRLRFRAGVLRLEPRGSPRAAHDRRDRRGAARSPTFDRWATDYDEIAYGGRAAGEADADAAREGWREVLR